VSDYLIDLGPEGGDRVAESTPLQIAENKQLHMGNI